MPDMASILKSLRVLADPNRLRILLLLEREELSVAELQEILGHGAKHHLDPSGAVEAGRAGGRPSHRQEHLVPRRSEGEVVTRLLAGLRQAPGEIPEAEHDDAALGLVLRKRQDKTRAFFDDMAGRFGREYVPGRSWKAWPRHCCCCCRRW